MHSKSAALRLQVESALAGRIAAPFRTPQGETPGAVPTGISRIDEVTGGLPRGSITEIYGPSSAGKTSFLQSALTALTGNSETCALVDAQDSFDPACAQAAGVLLRRLLWVRCQNLDNALRSLDLILHGGGFGMVAVDLSDAPARLVRQIPLNLWFRLRRTVENTSTILLVLSRESNTKTCASLVLRLEKEAATWSMRERFKPPHAVHTPASLFDGWTVAGEVIRTSSRRNRVYFLDRSADSGSNGIVRFPLRTEKSCSDFPDKERKRDAG